MAQLRTLPPDDHRAADVAALAEAFGLAPAWTLPGMAGRWTGPGVEIVLDDATRGGWVHVFGEDADATFGPDADPAEIASVVRAARPGGRWHTRYTEPHPDHGTWTSPPLCHATRTDAEDRIAGVTALAGRGAASRRTWTVGRCDGTCGR